MNETEGITVVQNNTKITKLRYAHFIYEKFQVENSRSGQSAGERRSRSFRFASHFRENRGCKFVEYSVSG